MRTAIIHYWLVGMRGGERVLEQFCRMFPDADIFTHVLRPERISEEIRRHRIECTFISKLPFATRHYQKYLGFMPRALEELDLSSYDLVISSESGPAKGVIPRPTATHVCYCHSPMRYVWDHYPLYKRELGLPARWVFERIAHRMRQWDVTAAARVDKFVANSDFVAARIRRYYRRDADIVHPPISLQRFTFDRRPADGYYLCVGELVRYKRTDVVVEAFRGLQSRLVVAGDGPEMRRLQKLAPDNVEFVGQVSREKLNKLYGGCRALVFPVEEDFGLVPVEAMACGRPVIAYGSGGALETVKEHETGLFFHEQTSQALRSAIAAFEIEEPRFDRRIIRRHAEEFSEERFRDRFREIVTRELDNASRSGTPARNQDRERSRPDPGAAVSLKVARRPIA